MPSSDSDSPKSAVPLPKRGARACVACRRGKNRCVNENGQAPCKRCAQTGAQCVFETPVGGRAFDEERLERLERTMSSLQGTVENLAGLFRSSITAPPAPQPPTMPPPFDPAPAGFSPASLQLLHTNPSPPVLPPQAGTSQQRIPPQPPMRIDSDFTTTTRSPTNQLHWDLGAGLSPEEHSLGPLLNQSSHMYHGDVLQPPTLPPIPPVTFSVSGPNIATSTQAALKHPAVASNNHNPLKRSRPSPTSDSGREHPPLPNYRAPPHPISQYGLVPSAVPSDDEDTLPTSSLTAPFEALAEAAAAAASGDGTNGNASGSATPKKRKRRRRRMPPPENAFPDVVEKGLVPEEVARQIFGFYFAHCHRFFAILDEKEDSFDVMRQRTPWTVDSMLSIAATRWPSAPPEIQAAAEHASEEAHGIARSSLFGPTVRKEGVQAMSLLAAFSSYGYLSTGHALRMAFELGLHRALEKIAAGVEQGKFRREEEEKDLLVSARVFLGLNWLDFVLSSGSGRPYACDEELLSSERLACMLRHPLAINTDINLCAQTELVVWRARVEQTMARNTGSFDTRTADFARRATRDLRKWHEKWDAALGKVFDEISFERKNIAGSMQSALIFLASTALKGSNLADVEHLSVDARELAMTARQASVDLIELWLHTPSLRESLRYATQSTFVDISFAGLLLLKLSRLFPEGGGSLQQVANQCHEVQHVLREMPGAERFALTISVALERFSKAFSIDLPVNSIYESNGALGTELLTLGIGTSASSPFEGTLWDDTNWVGSEVVPSWLSDPLAWSFTDLDVSSGLNNVFLPAWSTTEW